MYWCIYQITNKINGKRYIGQHKYYDESNPMRGYRGSGKLLKKAYKKYGFENFEVEILYKRILTLETANAMEIYAIDKYRPEYNIDRGGLGRHTEPGTFHHTDETKRKISKAHKGRKMPEGFKEKISRALKGREFTDEWRMRMSEAHNGLKHTAETCAKMSKSRTGQVWWTNGINETRSFTQPGEGWVRGRLKKARSSS